MKKVLLLLCILSITISARAQLFGRDWKEGAYYDSVGVKHTGLIALTHPDKHSSLIFSRGPSIHFKTGAKDSVVQIFPIQMRSFKFKADSVTIDSFVVSTDKEFKKKPFFKIVIAHDTDVVYCSTVMGALPLMGLTKKLTGNLSASVGIGLSIPLNTYYYGSNPNHVIKLSGKRFKETMSRLMADKPWVVKKIKDDTFTSSNMEDLMYFYKNDKLPDSMMPPVND